MTLLLDTHFLLWIMLDSHRLDAFPWLDAHRPWGVSPISLLEIQFLHEVGRLEARQPELSDALTSDPRFVIDEVPMVALVDKAIGLTWTRDPFDRLLAAHSEARRIPLCSLDRRVRDRHRFLPDELRS